MSQAQQILWMTLPFVITPLLIWIIVFFDKKQKRKESADREESLNKPSGTEIILKIRNENDFSITFPFLNIQQKLPENIFIDTKMVNKGESRDLTYPCLLENIQAQNLMVKITKITNRDDLYWKAEGEEEKKCLFHLESLMTMPNTLLLCGNDYKGSFFLDLLPKQEFDIVFDVKGHEIVDFILGNMSPYREYRTFQRI